MIGRTPANLRAVRPMRDGVIADYVITEAMLRHAINRVARIRLFRPEVMISVPSGVTSVERRAVRDAALKAGARAAFLIEEPLAAAIGANVEIGAASGSMIVDIGGGTTEIAVLSLGSIVVSDSLRVGGNKLDEAIAAYMRRTHNLMIGDRTAEAVKIDVGSAMPVDEPLRTEVKGRDTLGGLPRTVVVTSNEITRAMDAPLQAIVDAIRGVLERTPPELASDIIDKGMVLSGGTALLRNLDRLLTQVTGVPCVLADDPLHSVAIGTGIALENLNAYRKSLVTA
jgi:rod shape-determining protein MreB and related proteins